MPARKNPGGNKGQDKIWSDALRRAIKRPSEVEPNLKRIEVMADKCAKMAEKGDMTAMKEIGDRMEGRPHQSVAMTGDLTQWVVSEKELSPDEWQREYGNAVKGNGADKGNGSA